jgi:integrase
MTTIRFRYVKAYVDRHGKSRYYFRRKGFATVPLPSPGSPGFSAAYEAANAALLTPAAASNRVRFLPGSFGWAVEQFMASPAYAARAHNTRVQDKRVFDELRMTFGAGMLRDLRDRHVKNIRDYFRQKFSTSIADSAVSRVSVLWQFADQHLNIDLGANPTVGITRLHKVLHEHAPWPDDVIAAFEAHAPGHLRLAVMLLLYTGQRRSDVVKMRWSQFDGDVIEVAQQKTGEYVAIPCHHRLKAILAALPRRSEFILTGERGQPYQGGSLSVMVRNQLRAIGIHGYSVHGLRKNAAQALAEAQCSIPEIMAITGHRSPGMAMHYAKRAEKKRLAKSAMDRWEAAECLTGTRKANKPVSTPLKNRAV